MISMGSPEVHDEQELLAAIGARSTLEGRRAAREALASARRRRDQRKRAILRDQFTQLRDAA